MSSPGIEAGAVMRLEEAAVAALSAAEQAIADNVADEISDAAVQRLLTAGTRLFARKVEHENREFLPLTSPTAATATEAVVLLSAMLRAVNLSLFDLSMWMDGRASK